METTPTGKLAAALAKAQGEYTPVPKNKVAKVRMKSGGEYQYHYADLSDVLKMALPILAKHEICFTQPLRRSTDGRLAVTTVLIHASGDSQQSDGIAIPETLSPQEFGSCLSYWRRYDGCSMLGIAPDEDDDGKLATDAASKRPKKQGDTAVPADTSTDVSDLISAAQRKRLFAIIHEFGVNENEVKDYIFKQHGFVSSKDITKSTYEEICTWISGGANPA